MGLIEDAQSSLARLDVDAWVIYEHRRSNPVFHEIAAGGAASPLTRPVFYCIPRQGQPRILVHAVDMGHVHSLPGLAVPYTHRASLLAALRDALAGHRRVAMEYVPGGVLPLASRVDGGTLELIRSLGLEIVSSMDLVQDVTCRWTESQLASHLRAATALTALIHQAFGYIGSQLRDGNAPSEFEVSEYLRARLREGGFEAPDGPVVAVNGNASDPHYEPTLARSLPIRRSDWVLIDLWARERAERSVYADITWTAWVGEAEQPPDIQRAFDTVIEARDAAVDALRAAHQTGIPLRGFEADAVARGAVVEAGFGEFFTHRLGHSIGREVHGNGANLDGWETHDVRQLIPGTGFSVEPGIYIPGRFGVRSEINVYLGPNGPQVTTEAQREIVRIQA